MFKERTVLTRAPCSMGEAALHITCAAVALFGGSSNGSVKLFSFLFPDFWCLAVSHIRMEVERKKIKRDKLKAAFKVSKTKVRLWEEKFQAEQGRKPTKEERKQAPENVVVAWKNIWKIQAFFEQEDKDNKLAKVNDVGEHVDDCDPPVGLSLEDVKENLTEGGLLTAPVVGSEISSKVAMITVKR